MSGGVDSTLTARLLLEQGHEVIGFSLALGFGPDEALSAAPLVARQLGLAHQVVDASGPFLERVLLPTVAARNQGLTPNPCVLCNAGVKFPLLWHAARDRGCQMLATGHYCRLADGPEGRLLAEADELKKSQAYFLARLDRDLLKYLLFPLGDQSKARVRREAAARGLAVAEKPDSQDACFLPAGGWDELINRFGEPRPGPMVDRDGRWLADHRGLHHFTVGQRKGLGITGPAPSYVLSLCGRTAAVTVGPVQGLMADTVWAERPLWHRPPLQGELLAARLRSTQTPAPCRVWREEDGVKAVFNDPQRAVTPGQLAVFYKCGQVVGSGFITKAE